jgi:hypothetical protein
MYEDYGEIVCDNMGDMYEIVVIGGRVIHSLAVGMVCEVANANVIWKFAVT